MTERSHPQAIKDKQTYYAESLNRLSKFESEHRDEDVIGAEQELAALGFRAGSTARAAFGFGAGLTIFYL